MNYLLPSHKKEFIKPTKNEASETMLQFLRRK
jgi:hypothetical protein